MIKQKRLAVYKRVSTDKQETDSQQVVISDWLDSNTTECTVTNYQDISSGKTMRRPQFQQMLAEIEQGNIDCVVAYRLDRISRKTVDALRLIMRWIELGIDIIFIDQPILTATADDPFRMTKYAMFAELSQVERETLSRRVKAGLEAARRKGKRLGRQKKDQTYLVASISRMRRNGLTYEQISKELGMTRSYVSQLYRSNRD